MNNLRVYRKPWNLPYPDVVIHTTVQHRDIHESYHAAKGGDHDAANDLAYDLMHPDSLSMKALQSLIGNKKPILVPVAAIEQTGYYADGIT